MKLLLSAVAIALASASAANAYCPTPRAAPKPPQSYDKPRQPQCLAIARYGENDCDARELDRYSEDVEAYIKKLDDYVFDAERYAEDAAKFSRCEADEARESLGN